MFALPVSTGSLRVIVLIGRQRYNTKLNITIVIPMKADRTGNRRLYEAKE